MWLTAWPALGRAVTEWFLVHFHLLPKGLSARSAVASYEALLSRLEQKVSRARD